MSTMAHPDLPPVSDAHLQAAFAAMRWTGWSFEAAMRSDVRRRLVQARAAQLRTREWMETQRTTLQAVRRCQVGADGQALRWCTQMAPGPLARRVQDEIAGAGGAGNNNTNNTNHNDDHQGTSA